MKNCGFYRSELIPALRDCRVFMKKHAVLFVLSLLWCILGVVLGFLECGKRGSATFVTIYGERFYLVAIRVNGTGSVFSAEILVGLFLFLFIILSTFSRFLSWVPDVLFCFCVFLKTISIGFLFSEIGIVTKIVAIAVLIPCLILQIIWYCAFHSASAEFCPIGWKVGGFRRMWKCHTLHILLFACLYLLILIIEVLLFAVFCTLL